MKDFYGENIGIIKHSVGSTSLAKSWMIDNIKWSQYPTLLEKVKAAQKSRNVEIVGMLWMQGEADSNKEVTARSYAKNLSLFINKARRDFKSKSMIFLAGRINCRFPFVNLVRKAQEKCQEPNYAYINCDQLSKSNDNLHYDTKGIIDMGIEFSSAMQKMLKKL
jgi:hypothetical protein